MRKQFYDEATKLLNSTLHNDVIIHRLKSLVAHESMHGYVVGDQDCQGDTIGYVLQDGHVSGVESRNTNTALRANSREALIDTLDQVFEQCYTDLYGG